MVGLVEDKTVKWEHESVNDVTQEEVLGYFEPLDSDDEIDLD